jgi:ornithine cyclodeaminase/alanine dehydrogenase-like protein (mu-crystallin family)
MIFIDSKAISEAATIQEWINITEEAILASLTNAALIPQRMHIDHGRDTFLLMPCITDEYWTTKLVSFCPGNNIRGLPSIYGTVVLNSSSTGEPLAVMDGSKLTALRTAAVSAVGIKYLAPENARSLGVVGTGIQAIEQARFACSVRKIEKISVFDLSGISMRTFLDRFEAEFPGISIIVSKDAESVCSGSEIIITATNSTDPVFPDKKDLFTGKIFVGIGSYKPECREYPDAFFRNLEQIFTDTLHALKESGDLIYPVNNGLISTDCIYSLGSLAKGDISLSDAPTRFFKTVGNAIFDLYGAKLIYKKLSMSGADIKG